MRMSCRLSRRARRRCTTWWRWAPADVIQQLLDRLSSPSWFSYLDHRDDNGMNAFGYAVSTGHVEAMKLLLDKSYQLWRDFHSDEGKHATGAGGAIAEDQPHAGAKPKGGKLKSKKVLADPPGAGKVGADGLYVPRKHATLAELRTVEELRAYLVNDTADELQLINYAVQWDRIESVRTLLDYGADPTLRDLTGTGKLGLFRRLGFAVSPAYRPSVCALCIVCFIT
jgi:ankyrin repeat protein